MLRVRVLSAYALVAAPLLLAFACGEPFTGVVPDDVHGSAAGEPDGLAALRGVGGKPGVVSKPAIGGGNAEAAAGVASDAGGSAGDRSDAGAAGAAGSPGVSSRVCPMLGGETLVLADGFCIDESEVTVAHYQAFVAGHPSVDAQPAACAGNVSFANNCKSTKPEQEPQRCVDWCDARAYCESVGKHLCGSSSAAKGAMPYDAAAAAPDNQWYGACSHAGEVAYPYGDDYDTSACWSADRPPVGALMVKNASGCVGGYAGLWDMSGGLAEWVDSCNAEKGMNDACHIRGGSFSGTAEQLRCDWQSATPRNTSSNYIGFRCCAELAE
jgi:hypothetical protein